MRRLEFLSLLAFPLVVALGACGDDDDTGPSEEVFVATLTGSAERPNPVSTSATGTATMTVRGNVMDVTITVNNITGVTASHIHGPASAEEATIPILGFFANASGTGTINGTLVSKQVGQADVLAGFTGSFADVVELMRQGRAYVNVHTLANAGGEIRGQVRRQ